MTEPSGLTPEEEAEARRLLAGAAGVAPLPPAVAARLDAVLADLVAERDSPASVPAPRHRGRASRLLLAAAAVVLVGYVGTQLPTGSSHNDAPASATADRPPVPDRAPAAAEPRGTDLGSSAVGPPTRATDKSAAVTPEDARILGGLGVSPTRRPGRCLEPPLGNGDRATAVVVDGRRATVVLRRTPGGGSMQELYACDRPLLPVATRLVLTGPR